jgi:hypothetical protein
MRQAGKVDALQPQIVATLRKAGCSVLVLSGHGRGVPDLLAAYRGKAYLLEIKTLIGKRKPKPEPLTPAQVQFHATWRQHIPIITSAKEALDYMRGAPYVNEPAVYVSRANLEHCRR